MNTFVKYDISLGELNIDLHHAAPLLGYPGNLPEDMLAIVQEVMDETAELFALCGGCQIFDRIAFSDERRIVSIAQATPQPSATGETVTDFFPDKIVYRQLKRSEKIAVFVCTAGEGISLWSKRMMAEEPLKGFIADILGSVVVEAAVEALQQKLSDEMKRAGMKITNRYSPGYCGWPTSEQHKLFGLLPKENCGIRLAESALMLPIKSVSGFIGIGAHVRFNPYTCRMCDAVSCVYRRVRK